MRDLTRNPVPARSFAKKRRNLHCAKVTRIGSILIYVINCISAKLGELFYVMVKRRVKQGVGARLNVFEREPPKSSFFLTSPRYLNTLAPERP